MTSKPERNLGGEVRIWMDEEGNRQITFDGKPFPFYTDGEIIVQKHMQTIWPGVDAEDAVTASSGWIVMIPLRTWGGSVVVEGEPRNVTVLPDQWWQTDPATMVVTEVDEAGEPIGWTSELMKVP